MRVWFALTTSCFRVASSFVVPRYLVVRPVHAKTTASSLTGILAAPRLRTTTHLCERPQDDDDDEDGYNNNDSNRNEERNAYISEFTIVEDDNDNDDAFDYNPMADFAAKDYDKYDPPDFSVVPDDDNDDYTMTKGKEEEEEEEEDYDEWIAPPPKKEKRRQAKKNMLGTTWMDKNRAFLENDDDDDDFYEEEKTRGRFGSRKPQQQQQQNDRRRSGQKGKTFREDFRGTRVFVQNIPEGVSWQDLKDHFRMAGDVVFASISIDRETGQSKGHGVVQYETTAMAQEAILTMRNHPLQGNQLYVREDVQETTNQGGKTTKRPPTPPSKWKCANDPDDLMVVFGGQDVMHNHEEYKQIRSRIKARDDARRRRNYDTADLLREKLKQEHGVHLDDRHQMWWISLDRSVPSMVSDINGPGKWGTATTTPKTPWRQIPTTPENDLCVDPDLVEGLLKQRDIARREKDFGTADALLEQARTAPDGPMTLRIHDESRTWRIWTDEKPNFAKEPSSPKRGRRSQRDVRNDARTQCLELVEKHAPQKRQEVMKMLKDFPGREYNILEKLKDRFE